MTDTAIEWTRGPDGRPGKSWNPIRARNKATGGVGHFCVHVTEACRNCYAEDFQKRFRNFIRYAKQDRDKVDLFLDTETLLEPLHWRKPRRIFVCSMTDLFLEDHPDAWIDDVLAVVALRPQHKVIVLTKRGKRMRAYMNDPATPERIKVAMWRLSDGRTDHIHGGWPLRNVQIGVSCHDQDSADRIVPDLLAVPAAFRFVSHEPALGPVDWTHIVDRSARAPASGEHHFSALQDPDDEPGAAYLDLIIDGGESGNGPKVQPTHPDVFRRNRDQCAAAGTAYFHKQNGAWQHRPEIIDAGGPSFHRFPDGSFAQRVGKKAAGRLLDGREHNDLPN